MVGGGRKRGGALATALWIADAASWTCALALVALILVSSLREPAGGRREEKKAMAAAEAEAVAVRGRKLGSRACEEIYVVGEGETLHTISDKCGDPFIVERNPHIHDPDDVFPGLVIMLTPTNKPR